jgi:uncharacterized protein (DUF1330 family)
MTVYCIFDAEITDDSWIPEYVARITPLYERHGGKCIARSRQPYRLEGDREPPSLMSIVAFPSREAALAWYNDPDFQPLLAMRRKGSAAQGFLIDGDD